MPDRDILAEVEGILNQKAVVVHASRNWADFWCPFHNDAARQGTGGKPNLGVNLQTGGWMCLRCGISSSNSRFKGSALDKLRQELGEVIVKYSPPLAGSTRMVRNSRVNALGEAMQEARANVRRSPAWPYLSKRGIRPWTAMVYGIGYGVRNPMVSLDTWRAAEESMLVRRSGEWLWSGSVVYADPPTEPTVINVRYIPEDQLPNGERTFTPQDNHHTWGNRVQPLGAWRISPNTRLIIVLEGFFDMLAFAQALYDRGIESAIPVYTNGSSPSQRVLEWFQTHPGYDYLLVRDPDAAGEGWETKVKNAIRTGGGQCKLVTPPRNLDPDEALLAGWWPAGI